MTVPSSDSGRPATPGWSSTCYARSTNSGVQPPAAFGAPPAPFDLHARFRAPMNDDALRASEVSSMMDALVQPRQKAKLEKKLSVDFGYGVRGPRALPRQHLHAARHAGRVLPPHPVPDQELEDLDLPPVAARLLRPADGPGAGHRPDRQRQVDHARRADQAHLRCGGRCTSSPSRTRWSSCFTDDVGLDLPARGRHRHRRASPRRCATPLRQDPDVIMVGEMRDPETISTVITAAETGHLVFSTLHTNTARRPSTASSTPSRPNSRRRSAPSSRRCSRAWSR